MNSLRKILYKTRERQEWHEEMFKKEFDFLALSQFNVKASDVIFLPWTTSVFNFSVGNQVEVFPHAKFIQRAYFPHGGFCIIDDIRTRKYVIIGFAKALGKKGGQKTEEYFAFLAPAKYPHAVIHGFFKPKGKESLTSKGIMKLGLFWIGSLQKVGEEPPLG